MSCFFCGSSSQISKALKRINSKARRPPSVSPLLPRRQSQLDDKESNTAERANKYSGPTIKQEIFTFQELADATENFSQECLIDVGSFGNVYTGKLGETEEIVAVEKLDSNGSRGHREYLSQVLMLSLLNHPNLIKLIGYCAEGDERLLVREYLPLGSLDQHLHEVMGTFGYIAPEYEKNGLLTVKADVYSFGVVLLELITGRRAVDITRQANEQHLVSWAHRILKEPKKFQELADPLLEGNFPAKGLNEALAVAAMCLQKEQTARPMMSDVVTAIMYLTSDNLNDNTASPPYEHCVKPNNMMMDTNEFDHGNSVDVLPSTQSLKTE